ncbi:hypothetical protein IWQ60_005194 [Tieghemiomyces parasiticus]|uniref:Uncharacterized protein n=1 Tax=Tieghemiomyces parasiticus TaxID=78921 RepID=A0A9W8DZ34_9FUNG|nr:hypothetical protein IWQ60_005194 [Tieghemiomyces parasiticus]
MSRSCLNCCLILSLGVLTLTSALTNEIPANKEAVWGSEFTNQDYGGGSQLSFGKSSYPQYPDNTAVNQPRVFRGHFTPAGQPPSLDPNSLNMPAPRMSTQTSSLLDNHQVAPALDLSHQLATPTGAQVNSPVPDLNSEVPIPPPTNYAATQAAVNQVSTSLNMPKPEATEVVKTAQTSPSWIKRKTAEAIMAISHARDYFLRDMGQDLLGAICKVNQNLIAEHKDGLILGDVRFSAQYIAEDHFTDPTDTASKNYVILRRDDVTRIALTGLTKVMGLLPVAPDTATLVESVVFPNAVLIQTVPPTSAISAPTGPGTTPSALSSLPSAPPTMNQKVYRRGIPMPLVKATGSAIIGAIPKLIKPLGALLELGLVRLGLRTTAKYATQATSVYGWQLAKTVGLAVGASTATYGATKLVERASNPSKVMISESAEEANYMVCRAAGGSIKYTMSTAKNFEPTKYAAAAA